MLPALRGFQTRIRTEVKGMFPGGLTVDVTPRFDAGTMCTQAQAAARGAGQTVKFRAELDRRSLGDSIVGVATLSRALRTLAVPGAIVATTPYLLSLASSAVQAAGAVAALPAVLTAGGVAAGTLLVGLSGLGDAFKELTKADEAAAVSASSGAQSRAAAAERVRAAESSMRAAERGLADAQRDSRRAQEDLTQAREDARRELRDLQLTLEGAALSEEEAADRLSDARTQLAEAQVSGAGAEEIEDLDRAVRQADLSLREARVRYSDLQAEGREWARTGIEGSEGVRAAHERVGDAQRAELAAAEAVTEAQRQLAVAVTAGAAATTAATARADLAMAELSASGRDLVTTFRGLGPAWTALRLDVQERLLTGIAARVGALSGRYLPILNRTLGTTADAFNTATHSTADWALLPTTVNDVGASMDRVALGTGNAAGAMLPLTRAWWDLVAVGSGFLPAWGTGIADVAERLRVFVEQARASGQLRAWIQGGIDTLRVMWSIVGNVGSILVSAFGAAETSGESFLVTLDRVTGRVAAALRTPEGASGIRDFFTTTREVVGLFLDKLVQLWPVVLAGGGAFAALLIAASPLSSLLFTMLTTALVPILDAIGFLAPVLGPAVVLFGAWRLAVGLATLAMTAWRFAVSLATAISVAYQLAMGTHLTLTNAQTVAQSRHTIVTYAGAAAARIITAAQWLWNASLLTSLGSMLLMTARVLTMTVIMGGYYAVLGAARVATLAWTGVQWLLNAALSANPIGLVVVLLAGLVAAVVYAWRNFDWFRNAVQLAWSGIQLAVQVAWNMFIKPVFDALLWVIRNVIGPAVMWFWRTVVEPAWNAIGTLIHGVWTGFIQPTFNAVVGGLDWLGNNFTRVVDWIGGIWDRLKGLLAKPINFMIGTVWNSGIRKAWNLVAGLLPGVEPVGELPLIAEFARGGVYPGYTPGRDIGYAKVSGGEAIMRPEFTRVVGPQYVSAANEAARVGGTAGVQAFLNTVGTTSSAHEGRAKLRLMRDHPLDGRYAGAYAYGGVAPHVARAGQEIERLFGRMPGGIGGVGQRSGASDHPSGHALDFMVLHRTDLGHRISGHFLANAKRLAMKYIIWRQQINSGGGWKGMENRGSPTANHMDHPHVSFLRTGESGQDFSTGGGGGGFFDFVKEKIRGWVRDLVDPLIEKLPKGPPRFLDLPRNMATLVRDKMLEWFLGKADEGASVGPGPGGGVERWRPVVDQALGIVGQPLLHANRTLRRMNQESGGNPRAVNNSDVNAQRGYPSTGLMQVIRPTYQRHRHPQYDREPFLNGVSVDPLSNILSSMRYALSRYGNLPSAYDRKGGYDDGGVAYGSGFLEKFRVDPERVLNASNTRSFDTLIGMLASGRLDIGSDDADARGGPVIGTMYVTTPTGATPQQMFHDAFFYAEHHRKGMHG